MGRLKGLRLYEAGPMQYADDEHSWRDLVADFCEKRGVQVLNPAARTRFAKESGEIRDEMVKLMQEGKFTVVRERGRHIRNVDLRWVDISDFLIIYLDLNIHTYGTFEEMFLANRSKKPVLIVIPQLKSKTPLWLMWTFPEEHIFSSFDELFNYLDYIDSAPEIENPGNRWVFTELSEATASE